jgi:hypothetical protein
MNFALPWVQQTADSVKGSRFARSIPANEALKLKVVDLLASDLNDLLLKIDGKTVEKPWGTIKLSTKGAKINFIEMGFRQRFLSALSNPNLAYILMMIGISVPIVLAPICPDSCQQHILRLYCQFRTTVKSYFPLLRPRKYGFSSFAA